MDSKGIGYGHLVMYIGVGVIAIGSMIFIIKKYFGKKKEAKYIEFDKKIKDLPPLKQSSGKLLADSVHSLMVVVKEESQKSINTLLKSFVRERRKLLRDNEFSHYLEVCQEYLDSQSEIEEEYLVRALRKLKIEREDFEESIEENGLPEVSTESISKKALETEGDKAVMPSLTKERTKEIFISIVNLENKEKSKYVKLFEELEEITKVLDQRTAAAVKLGIKNLIMCDILNIEYNITEEQLAEAIQEFKINEDPDIMAMQETIKMN